MEEKTQSARGYRLEVITTGRRPLIPNQSLRVLLNPYSTAYPTRVVCWFKFGNNIYNQTSELISLNSTKVTVLYSTPRNHQHKTMFACWICFNSIIIIAPIRSTKLNRGHLVRGFHTRALICSSHNVAEKKSTKVVRTHSLRVSDVELAINWGEQVKN